VFRTDLRPLTFALWRRAVPLVLFAALWLDLIRQLSYMWESNEQYAFGWFVPVLAIGLVLSKWSSRPAPEPAQPPRSFLITIGILALLFLPARVVHEVNQDWAMFSWLITLTIVGLTLYAVFLIGGWPWVKHFGFAICFILVAVRWPYRIENSLTYRLMSLVTTVTVEALGVLGVPAVQHGHLIEVSTGTVGVDEACSGIRSVQSSIMAALLMGELYRLRLWARAALLAFGLLFAFLFNVARTMFLTWQADAHGVDAIDKWHDPAGISITVACFLSLWAIAVLVAKRWSTKAPEISPTSGPPAPPTSDLRPPPSIASAKEGLTSDAAPSFPSVESAKPQLSAFNSQLSTLPPPTSVSSPSDVPRPEPPSDLCPPPSIASAKEGLTSGRWRRYAIALGCWCLLAIAATEAWYRSHEVNLAPNTAWWASFPTNSPSAREIPMSKLARSKLKYDQASTWAWEEPDGSKWAAYCFRWNAGVASSRMAARDHRPEYCLGGSGYNCQADLGISYFPAQGLELPFRNYVFERGGVVLYVFHCLWEEGALEQRGFGTSKYLDRLRAVQLGKRYLGQQTLEIVVSGYANMEEAERAVRRRLPGLIQPGAR